MKINITIKTKNMDLTPAVKEYVEKKMSTLERFVGTKEGAETLVEVDLGLRNRHHKKGDIYRAEVNLTMDKKFVRAVSVESDLYAAIDSVKDQIVGRITSERTKISDIARRSAKRLKRMLKFGRE